MGGELGSFDTPRALTGAPPRLTNTGTEVLQEPSAAQVSQNLLF